MNQLQENESSNEGREMEGMEFLEENPLESIKKFNIELESEVSEPKGSDDLIELYFRKMSRFPLLKRDEELEVSKHFEMKIWGGGVQNTYKKFLSSSCMRISYFWTYSFCCRRKWQSVN